jgi:hypothetical protein
VQAMAWWLIPITATLLAVAWVTWRARPKPPADPHETLAAHRRFTEALSPPTPLPPASTPGDDSPATPHVPSTPEHRRSA